MVNQPYQYNSHIPNSEALEKAIISHLEDNGYTSGTIHEYKNKALRFIRVCIENNWNPLAPLDEAISILTMYFQLRNSVQDRFGIRVYYDVMGRTNDLNPIKHINMNDIFYKREQRLNSKSVSYVENTISESEDSGGNETDTLSSLISAKTNNSQPHDIFNKNKNIFPPKSSPLSLSKSDVASDVLPNNKRNNLKDVSLWFNFKIPSQRSAKSLEAGIVDYLSTYGLSINSQKTYRHNILTFLRVCHEQHWNPIASYNETVRILIAYFGFPKHLGQLSMERTSLKVFYEMMGKDDQENPIMDTTFKEALKEIRRHAKNATSKPPHHFKLQSNSDDMDQSVVVQQLEIEVEMAKTQYNIWHTIYKHTKSAHYDKVLVLLEEK